MKTNFNLVLLLITAIMPGWAHAEKPGKTKGNPGGEAKARATMPAAQLDTLVGPCVEAILASLDKDPKAPTGQVAKLHSNFTVALNAAETPQQKQIYTNAIAVCQAITKALDDRAKSKARAEASAKMLPLSTAGSINKSSPQPGRKAGYLALQIRKKQEEERAFAEREAKKRSEFLSSGAYTAWAERAPKYRQDVMTLYTRQAELERLLVTHNAPVTKPAPTAANAPENTSNPRGKKAAPPTASFVGTWSGPKGLKTYLINDDHTAMRTAKGNEKTKGTWTVDQDGAVEIKWADQSRSVGQLSADGKTLRNNKSEQSWTRKAALTSRGAGKGVMIQMARFQDLDIWNLGQARALDHAGSANHGGTQDRGLSWKM